MKLTLLLILFFIFITINNSVYADVIALDCRDDPSADPDFCREGLDCSNPRYSVCASCIFSGAIENCKDQVDNNCNQDESELLDSNPDTGIDRRDISCCNIFWWNWTDQNNAVISNAISNQQVFLSVRGTAACVGKSLSFDIFESDGSFIDQSIGVTDVTPDPNSVVFDVNGNARSPWTVVYIEDFGALFGNEPEYRFNATIFDAATTYFSELSSELQVSRARECEIRQVLWANACSSNGKEIVVTIIGNEFCNGRNVNLELYEYETAFEKALLKFPDDHYSSTGNDNFPITQPGTVIFTDNRAIKQIILQYHNGNDDGENNDLEYKVTATTNGNSETSDVLKVKQCNNAIDSDCDNILNTRDLCSNTPVCSDVDDDGCTSGQESCLAEWDCSGVNWSECDEDTGLRTRDIGNCDDVINNPSVCKCQYLGTNPLCQTEFKPITSISCIEEEEFPFFTIQNIIITILILIIYYYIFLRTKKKKHKKRKKYKKYKKARR